MTTLVVGASGATGRKLVEQLLDRGEDVRVIVRSPEKLLEGIKDHGNLSVTQASVLDLSDADLARHVSGCDAVASCLGHNISLRGVFGPPFRLVTEATRRLCDAIKTNSPEKPTRFVLMNTVAVTNRDLDEPRSLFHRFVIWLVSLLVPPQADNEQAADHLRTKVQEDGVIEWAVVRPDALLDESEVSEYEVHPSPTRSGVTNPGSTSRINVGHFMAELITDDETWSRWKGQMPAIYNRESEE